MIVVLSLENCLDPYHIIFTRNQFRRNKDLVFSHCVNTLEKTFTLSIVPKQPIRSVSMKITDPKPPHISHVVQDSVQKMLGQVT